MATTGTTQAEAAHSRIHEAYFSVGQPLFSASVTPGVIQKEGNTTDWDKEIEIDAEDIDDFSSMMPVKEKSSSNIRVLVTGATGSLE